VLSAWYSFLMKNTVMVPLVFFSNLLLWIVVFSFFSVFASPNGMTTLTSGSVAVFFHECLYRAVFYAPLALSITLMAVFFFLMRHKTIVWITALTVLALLVLCIFLVMPLSYRFLEDNTWTFLSNRSELAGTAGRVFSPNVIRPDGDSSRMVWYSVRDDGRKVAPLLVAGSDKTGSVFTRYPEAVYDGVSGGLVSGDALVVSRASGTDPSFLPVFTPPPVVALAVNHIDRVMDAFQQSFRQGFAAYTLFSSAFFLSMALVWLFSHASGWRLLNILFSISGLLYIFGAYTLYSRGPVFSFFRQFLPAGFSSGSVPAFLYFLQAAVMALLGLSVFVRRLVRHEGRG